MEKVLPRAKYTLPSLPIFCFDLRARMKDARRFLPDELGVIHNWGRPLSL
jgi:hypothetical protein